MYVCMYVIVIQWHFAEYELYTQETRGRITPEGRCVYKSILRKCHCIIIIYPAQGFYLWRISSPIF